MFQIKGVVFFPFLKLLPKAKVCILFALFSCLCYFHPPLALIDW